MSDTPVEIRLHAVDLERLRAVAAAVARVLRAGDAIVLSGPLAAGKTAFVKMLAAALGCPEEVTSPTFTLAHFYHGSGLGLIHVDAYRLETAQEFDDLTLDDFLDANAIAVEWGEKVRDRLPPALEIAFAADGPETRRLTVRAADPAWRDRLRDIGVASQGLGPCP